MNNMRPPPSSSSSSSAAARPVYQDFVPLSEWKQDHSAHLLLVHLPGFTRDHIRLTSEPSNIIKVRGERSLLTNNKWARFNQDYSLPPDSTIQGVRAKLESGTLTITMPKKPIIAQDPPPKPIMAPAPSQNNTEAVPKKDYPHPQNMTHQITKPAVLNPPAPKQESPHQPNPQNLIDENTVQNPPTPKKESPFQSNPQKFIDDIKRKIMDATTPTPPKVEDNQIEQDKNMHKSVTTEKASTDPPTPPTSLEDLMKNVVHMPNDNKAEADQPKKNQKGHESRADITDKEKEKYNKGKDKEVSPAAELKTKLLDTDEETKNKDSAEKTNATGGDQLENFNKMVQGLTLRIKEDRESLVNVGVAVLILLALGIYVSH